MTVTDPQTAPTTGAPTAPPAEVVAAAALPARIVAAWAAHDSAAFAAVFAADGSMILPGLHLSGRDAIAAFMARAFTGPYRGTRVVGTPFDARVLAPGVVLLLTEGGVIPDGRSELPEGAAVRASWLVVERDGRWQLAAYQNSPRD